MYDRADAAVTTATADEVPTGTIREAVLFLTSEITPAPSSTGERTVGDALLLVAPLENPIEMVDTIGQRGGE